MLFQNIYHIGDTKSAQELEVFLRMPKERLPLGCGLQCTDSLKAVTPRQRSELCFFLLAAAWVCPGQIALQSAKQEG